MIDYSLKTLLDDMSAFISNTVPAIVKLDRGAGVVADIFFKMFDLAEKALDQVRQSTTFDDLTMLQMVSINALQASMTDIKGYITHMAAENYEPDFSPIYARPTGGVMYGFSSVAGDLAESAENVMYWISDLKEISRNENFADIISFSGHSVGKPYNIFSTPESETPITIASDFNDRLTDLFLISKTDITSTTGLIAALDAVTDLFGTITFDEDKIPTDYPNEYLIKLEGVKYYTVGPDDTLQSIAFDQLGSADKWREIAAINDIIIENPAKIYLPISTITYAGDLAAGSNGIPYAGDWNSNSVAVGSLIAIEDSLGMKQKLVVKSVDPATVEAKDEPARVYTQETFSQYFHGPITITRYDNRAAYGTYDTTTTLASAATYGTKKLYVDSAKDIFKGYLLCIIENDLSYFYTVSEVDYINCIVTIAETNQNHAIGRTVEIYDTYSRLSHLEEGTVLKIPRTSGNESSGNIIQSYAEIFGTDLELDDTGLLETSDGDLTTLSGLPNFKQAIKQRIMCPYKNLIFHPEYGCGLWSIIGEKNTAYWETAAKATIIDALNHEPRIKSLARFSMATTPDSIRFDIIVNPVDQNTPSDLNFVIDT